MQRLVEANSRPFIEFTLENVEHAADDAITQAMTVLITNPGAGAARIERFSVLVDGKPVEGMKDALLRLAGTSSGNLGSITYADVAPSYVKAGSERVVLRWPRTEANGASWDRVTAAEHNRVKFEACYCSIFDECWIENSDTFRPTPVKSCAV
jgi:hypothetical protein